MKHIHYQPGFPETTNKGEANHEAPSRFSALHADHPPVRPFQSIACAGKKSFQGVETQWENGVVKKLAWLKSQRDLGSLYVSFLRCRVGRKKGETHLQFRSGIPYTTMSVEKKNGWRYTTQPPWRILWVWRYLPTMTIMNGWFFMVPYSRSGLEVICAVWVILVPSDLAIKC